MRAAVAIRHHTAAIRREQEFVEQASEAPRFMTDEAEYPLLISDYLDPEKGFPGDQKYPRPSLKLLGILFEQVCCLGWSTRRSLERSVPPEQADFANNVILPMSGVPVGPATLETQLLRDVRFSGCRDAELFFVDALKQVRTRRSYGHVRLSIYHDSTGQPVLFRKKNDVSSALTLIPLSVESLRLPAGTIVGLPRTGSRPPDGVRQYREFHLASYLLDHESELSPIRLSPWAYDEAIDRSSFAIDALSDSRTRRVMGFYYDSFRGRMVEQYSLEDFRVTAEKALIACGVT